MYDREASATWLISEEQHWKTMTSLDLTDDSHLYSYLT